MDVEALFGSLVEHFNGPTGHFALLSVIAAVLVHVGEDVVGQDVELLVIRRLVESSMTRQGRHLQRPI